MKSVSRRFDKSAANGLSFDKSVVCKDILIILIVVFNKRKTSLPSMYDFCKCHLDEENCVLQAAVLHCMRFFQNLNCLKYVPKLLDE